MARVGVPSGYGPTFNTPRQPRRHVMVPTRTLPLRRLAADLEAVAAPLPGRRDLLHTFNGIPLTAQPWMVSFESSLPRAFGQRAGSLRRVLTARLLKDNCLAVVPISDYAFRRFAHEHADGALLDELAPKLRVIHPNVPLVSHEPKSLGSEGLRLLFVGREWARKGGVVALRVADEAHRRGLPVHVTIVSSLGMAGFAQHPDPTCYQDDLRLLALPNVTHHAALPNARVLALMDEADLTLLTTAHDTYGYSVLEGMAAATPAVVTRVAALQEVVQDGVNGISLPVELDGLGGYAHTRSGDWTRWDRFYSDLAEQTLARLESLLEDPSRYQALSRGAIARVREHHEAGAVGEQIELLYDGAARGTRAHP